MNFKNKNILFVAISLVVFILLAVAYANPIISGKQLLQHDIVQYKGGAKELLITEPTTTKKPIGAMLCSEECLLIKPERNLEVMSSKK
jgi:hypothetical protein